MATIAASPPSERLVILPSVSWETYQRLLAEHNPGRGIRFTFDQGALQIMTLSTKHEKSNRILASLVEAVAAETVGDVLSLGSITIRRQDLLQGLEPDSCFYIRNLAQVKDAEGLDFTVDPPPDLVIEVDVTTDSLNKFPIFAAVGIGEVWRFDGEVVRIHRLEGKDYIEVEASVALPPLTACKIAGFLETRKRMTLRDCTQSIRTWLRQPG